MKKFHFIPLGLAFITANMAFAADEIHYTITGQNSVTFDWRGTAIENSIGFGLSPGAYTQVKAIAPNPVPNSSQGPFWEAKLTGLKENSIYYYSIGNGPERTFRTAPVLGGSGFTVYAQGDIGDTTTYFNVGAVQDLVANGQPAFVIGLGNLARGLSNDKAAIDQHFNDVMAWSKTAAYMPIWGDQEWQDTGKVNIANNFTNYKGRFDLPNSQTSPGTPLVGGKDWYWFDYGNARFIALPEEPWAGARSDWNAKADALMAQAQADPNIQYIVTFGYRPAYSSGRFSGSSTLKSMLDTLGGKHSKYVLNLNSQSRNYERSHPQHGVVHLTAGIGGTSLSPDGACLWLTCPQPSWSAYRAMHQGALKLNFTTTGIDGAFICGPAGGGANDVNCIKGSVVDSFKITSTSAAAPTASNPVVTSNGTATDTQAPSVPTNLKATASSSTQVALSWSASTDNQGVTGYKIYRNNAQIGSSAATTFGDSGLTPATGYTYTVTAFDGAGNASAISTASAAITSASAPTTVAPVASAPATLATATAAAATASCAPAPTSSLVVNVKNKGAKGNGSANDTAAIQAAINQVAGTGGTVLIPDGIYMINAAPMGLFPKSNMTIKMTSGAILKAMPTSSGKYSLLRIEKVSNVNVIGGKLQGERKQHQGSSGEYGYGVMIVASTNVAIQGVTAVDMWGDGFYVGSVSRNAKLCSVIADNNRRQGISIVSADGVIVKDSIFKNSNGVLPQSGVQIEPNANETVKNVQILNTQALNNKGWGLKLTAPASGSSISAVTLNGNTVTGNGIGTSADGIAIARTSGHRITNNIVKNNRQAGITLIAGSSNNIVTGNIVTTNGASGVVSSSIGIQMWDRATKNTVINNTVTGHKKANIRDFVGGNTITPNKVN